jgi:hypothetical protein
VYFSFGIFYFHTVLSVLMHASRSKIPTFHTKLRYYLLISWIFLIFRFLIPSRIYSLFLFRCLLWFVLICFLCIAVNKRFQKCYISLSVTAWSFHYYYKPNDCSWRLLPENKLPILLIATMWYLLRHKILCAPHQQYVILSIYKSSLSPSSPVCDA